MGCTSSKPDTTPTMATISVTNKVPSSFNLGSNNPLINSSSNNKVLTNSSNKSGGSSGSSSNSSSNSTVATTTLSAHEEPPELDGNGKLTRREIVKRTVSSPLVNTITVGSDEFPVQIEYAYWSQRGYYPDDPFKENQDAFVVPTTNGTQKNKSDALWCVLDGHGPTGHECSAFAKQHLPRLLEKYLRQARVQKYKTALQQAGKPVTKLFDPTAWPLLNAQEYQSCCQKAFIECNKNMQTSEKVKAKLSGTTATIAALHGNLLTVANVGDSRVVLGHRLPTTKSSQPLEDADTSEEAKLPIGDDDDEDAQDARDYRSPVVAIPLSRDQTPYRQDERDRVRQMGGSIMTVGQMEGKDPVPENMDEYLGDMVLGQVVDFLGDKPRVWLPGQKYPGCAFTRSLGDAAAEAVGVTAEPEMLSRELTENDEILILASDGIFEFLTNQEVLDMARICGTPLRACECLVEAAYDLWMKYEPRSDDITIIVCYIKCSKPVPDEGWEETTESLVNYADLRDSLKPVRRPPGSNENLCCVPSTIQDVCPNY